MQVLLWSPLLVAAGLLAAGSIAIMLLPEMAHKPLEDTVEDAQDSEVMLTPLTLPAHRQCSTAGQYDLEQSPGPHSSRGQGSQNGSFGQHLQPRQSPAIASEMEMVSAEAAGGLSGGMAQGRDRDGDVKEERLGLLRDSTQL